MSEKPPRTRSSSSLQLSPGRCRHFLPCIFAFLYENPRAVAARTFSPVFSVSFVWRAVAIWEALYSSVSHLATIARATSKAIVVACCQKYLKGWCFLMADKKIRNFAGVIYPDSESYNCDEVISRIKSKFKQWAFCCHDTDFDDEGNHKKTHIHWVGAGDARTMASCAKILGLPEHDIEICRNSKLMVRYLLHLDDPDKCQYPPEALDTNWKNIDQIIRNADEGILCKDLCSAKTRMSWYDLIQYSIDTCSFDVLRRNLGLIKLVNEERGKVESP